MTESTDDAVSVTKAPVAEEDIPMATSASFQSKKPRQRTVTIDINGEKVKFLVRAIGRKHYDLLMTSCPPSTKERSENYTYSPEKFEPLLVSKVVITPQMSEAEWRNVWSDESWNGLELQEIFMACVNTCRMTTDLDPTALG